MFSGVFLVALLLLFPSLASARNIRLDGTRHVVCAEPGRDTQIIFPSAIVRTARHHHFIAVDRRENVLILFATNNAPEEGEALPVTLDDGSTHSFLVVPTSACDSRDAVIRADY